MRCWVCGSRRLFPTGSGRDIKLRPESFNITDSHYGITLPRYRCEKCGFIQCDTDDVTKYYEKLEDKEYINSSKQRALQFNMLLKSVEPFIPAKGRILDIGAGSGIFMRQAIKRGYSVTGIEPSKYLAAQGRKSGLDIICGVFPNDCPKQKYDVIFLTDVIEHIVNPLSMIRHLKEYLSENGCVIITTPDVSSFMARLLGKHWWHYRVAHVGYYNKGTLTRIMRRAGLTPVKWKYARWYFSSRYIIERLAKYISFVKPFVKIAPENLMIPVNLFDSWIGIFEARE